MDRCLASFGAFWGDTSGSGTGSGEEKAETLPEVISDASFQSIAINQHVHEEAPRHGEARGSCFGDRIVSQNCR
jgi:hypothetical protein